jgi:hypothetical protein
LAISFPALTVVLGFLAQPKKPPPKTSGEAGEEFGVHAWFNCVPNLFQPPRFNPAGGGEEKFSIRRKSQGQIRAKGRVRLKPDHPF